MSAVEQVVSIIEQLKVGKKNGGASPHKYLMLLSLIHFLEQNKDNNNIFYFKEIEPVFADMMQKMFPDYPYYSVALEYPFYHLQSDGIWHLKIKEGKEKLYAQYRASRLTKKRILETVEYSYLSDDVFSALRSSMVRKACKDRLLQILERKAYTKPSGNNEFIFEPKSLFEHEQFAIEEIYLSIKNQLSAKCLSNVYIWDHQTNAYLEYDLIVVARSGIYVIELKHWTGNIEIKEYQWRINKTKYRTDPHKNNSFKCKVLKGIYRHKFVTFPDVWVESIVVLTNPEANVDGADTPGAACQSQRHNFTFGSISDFIAYLKRKEGSMRVLDDRQIEVVVDYIEQLNKPTVSQKEYTVNGYKTVEYLSQKPEYIELLARPLGIKAKGLHRLRVFRPIQKSQEERERFKKSALSTLNAVEQIGDSPYIQRVWVLPSEDGDIIEVSDWSETGTLQDLIYDTKGGMPLKTALSLCRSIALGLRQAHENNIIHRAVKPENILVKNDIPKLMNFDLSFQLEDNRLTVIPDASKVKDDGYVAPELLIGDDIDETTDFFSLGVIAYQLLTGEKPFKATREFVARGGHLLPEAVGRLEKANVSSAVIRGIEKMVVADRAKRLKSFEEVVSVFTCESQHDNQVNVGLAENNKLLTGAKYDMYEIIEFIGEGSEAQLYKAKAKLSRGQPTTVVLKVFNSDASVDRMYNELDIGSKIRSPYVVGYERLPGHWHGKRFFIVMDYVHGETLRKLIERGESPTREAFDSVARSLMEGIRVLHENKDDSEEVNPIIHGDIKPENIIITPQGKPVIIDLGIAGPPRVDAYKGTAGYISPDSIRGADRHFSPRSDLFALGVTLWEWLFGQLPYASPSVGDKPVIPNDLPEFKDLYSWLKKAVSTDPNESFASITDMWNEFTKRISVEEKEDKIEPEAVKGNMKKVELGLAFTKHENPFVSYLKTLSCDSAGNENSIAESQINNENFNKVHVFNPLADVIYDLLGDGKNVILTGNAGDGKTTIAVDVLHKFGQEKLHEFDFRHEVPEHNLVVIKDMSELPGPERSSVLKEAIGSKTLKYLIVSNTGTLLDSFNAIRGGFDINFSELLTALRANEPSNVMGKFCLINIGQLDSIETACKVFERMLHLENWTECSQCKWSDGCPLKTNVQLLQSNLGLVRNRVYLLYKRLYEYGQRLTMRQMTGHLAYAITGGLSCREIKDMSLMAKREYIWRAGFFNRFFGDDGHKPIPAASKLLPVRVIREAGFGLTLLPKFERKAWLKNEIYRVFNDKAREVWSQMLEGHSPQAIDKPVLRRQIRRLAFFCGNFEGTEEKEYISTFLDSPMLIDYLEDISGNKVPPSSKLRKLRAKVLHILQEHFAGFRLPEDSWKGRKDIYITLNPPGSLAATQMILARFREDDFELVVEPRYQCGKEQCSNQVFVLRYGKDSNVFLELDLPFFDYVSRRYQGDMSHQLSAYYSNRFEDFKGKLLQAYNRSSAGDDTLYLLRIRPDRRFDELTLLIGEDKIEVI